MSSQLLQPAALTPAKLLQLGADETQYATVPGVSVFDGSGSRALHAGGSATVTSHHVMWVDNALSTPLRIRLGDLGRTQLHASFFRFSPRIDLYSKYDLAEPALRLHFDHHHHASDFHGHLEKARGRKAWEREEAKKQKQEAQAAFSPAMAGIGGIFRQEEQQRAEAAELTQDAFSDLDSLMVKARDLVDLLERYGRAAASSQSAKQGSSGGSSSGGADQQSEAQFNDLLHSLGVANPVTRERPAPSFTRPCRGKSRTFCSSNFRATRQVA